MVRISTSSRYVKEITGPDLLSLVELGGGGVIRKKFKNEVFVTYERMIRS